MASTRCHCWRCRGVLIRVSSNAAQAINSHIGAVHAKSLWMCISFRCAHRRWLCAIRCARWTRTNAMRRSQARRKHRRDALNATKRTGRRQRQRIAIRARATRIHMRSLFLRLKIQSPTKKQFCGEAIVAAAGATISQCFNDPNISKRKQAIWWIFRRISKPLCKNLQSYGVKSNFEFSFLSQL